MKYHKIKYSTKILFLHCVTLENLCENKTIAYFSHFTAFKKILKTELNKKEFCTWNVIPTRIMQFLHVKVFNFILVTIKKNKFHFCIESRRKLLSYTFSLSLSLSTRFKSHSNMRKFVSWPGVVDSGYSNFLHYPRINFLETSKNILIWSYLYQDKSQATKTFDTRANIEILFSFLMVSLI